MIAMLPGEENVDRWKKILSIYDCKYFYIILPLPKEFQENWSKVFDYTGGIMENNVLYKINNMDGDRIVISNMESESN